MDDLLPHLQQALRDRYVIERELGTGGMATVYLADDVKHGRKVALKIFRPELAPAVGKNRFVQEVRIAAQLNHPNILALYDSGETDGVFYYVMPHITGETLRTRLDREKRLAVDDAIRITCQVAAALGYAHAQGVVHRDIKPENILIHEGVPLVADFGIALAVSGPDDTRITGSGIAVGTPAYMSPEQLAGEQELDARVDIYSLACVLYELLTGEAPHAGPSARAIMTQRMIKPAPAVRSRRAEVTPRIERALAKALARAPDDRFATATEFANALISGVVSVTPAPPSIAVLPFRNLSTDPENEFFADGITEDVIAQLAKLHGLKVISRTSVMAFKDRQASNSEIAAALDVTNILEGSVRRAGGRVRIVAQLIDAMSDRHLWSDTYDRQLTDIFEVQADVAEKIAEALKTELTSAERSRLHREPTTNFKAYQYYLQGRHLYARYTDADSRRGVQYFERAIAEDPEYALAHTALALSFTELAIVQATSAMRPEEAYTRASELVARALELDNDLGEAHGMRALLRFVWDFDWAGAESEFKLALELSPNSADVYDHYGWLCSSMRRFDEALTLVMRAQELDPLAHRSDVPSTLLRAGQFAAAKEAAFRAIEFDPEFPRAHSALGWAHFKMGEVQEGLQKLQDAVALVPGHTMFLAQLGEAYAMAGETTKARDILDQLETIASDRYVPPYHFAYVHTGLGERDKAIDYLEQARAQRAGGIYGVWGSFLFTSLHDHPRFKALLQTMNLGSA